VIRQVIKLKRRRRRHAVNNYLFTKTLLRATTTHLPLPVCCYGYSATST